MEPYMEMLAMAEGCKTNQGLQQGSHSRQTLELNWAGCDVYGRDLLDLDEVDSELLNIEQGPSDEAEKGIFPDINVNHEKPSKSRQVSWGCVEKAHLPLSPRNVPGKVLSSASARKSPEYLPTLLELQVQALAKLGLVNLYHDSKDLEGEEARAGKEKNLAILNQLDCDRQALSPSRSHRQQQDRGTLEPQKLALSSMEGIKKSLNVVSTLVPSAPSPLEGDGDLLELQKVALSNMTRTTNQLLGGIGKDQPSSTEGTDLLELQKVALASMRILSEKILSKSTTSTSRHIPQPSAMGGDLLELQQTAPKLASPIEHATGGDLLELQKVALKSTSNLPSQQAKEGGDLLEQQKVPLKSVPYQGAPSPPLFVVTQPREGDLLELQKLALGNVQKHLTPTLALRCVEKGPRFLEEEERTPGYVESQTTPTPIQQHGGQGDLLDTQNATLTEMSFREWEGGKVLHSEETKLKQQNNTQGDTSPTSSPVVLDKMPTREALEKLSQELSTKELALQFASRTIDGKDRLLREYEGSLASALSLLQSMNVQCTTAKVETAKALIEAEEIYGSLIATCSAIENFDHLIPTCGKDAPILASPSSTTKLNDIQNALSMKNGLRENQLEIDEHRDLVEELVRELHNIEVARKEAKEGCELQIQKNEQLIAELQRLDVAPPISVVPFDHGDVEQKPQEITKLYEILVANGIGIFQPTFGNKSLKDKAKGKECGHAGENPIDEGKESLCDDAHKNPSDEAEGNECVHVYEDPRDQANGNLSCDHVHKDSSARVYESAHCQVPQDLDQKAEKMPGGNVGEIHPGNDKANQKPSDLGCEAHPTDTKGNESPCDHVYESYPSDDKANEKPCAHVYESPSDQAKEALCDHVHENLYDFFDEKSCDHIYQKPGDQSGENKCDNADKNPDEQSKEIQCDHSFENPPGQAKENPCDNADKNPDEQSTEIQCDHSFENPPGQAKENPCDHTLEQKNKQPCDHIYEHIEEQPLAHALQSSSEQTCDNPNDHTSETLVETPSDHAYEDGKDCDPLHELEDITSNTLTTPTWVGQLTISLTVPEVKVFAKLKSIETSLQRNSYKYVTTTSGPNSLWEHLQHFVKKQPQASDDAEKIQLSMELTKLKGDLDLRTQELQSHLERKSSEIRELRAQISQLQTALLQEQENMTKILLEKASDVSHGLTIADLEHKDRVIQEMNFQMHQMEVTLRQEREEMAESLTQKAKQLEATLCQEREEMRESLTQKADQLEAALCQEREEMRESLTKKTNQLEATLCQEREEMRKVLVQRTTEMNRAALATAVVVDPDLRAKEINELHHQLHQMQRELQEKNNNLIPSLKVEMDNLQGSLHTRDEDLRELQETMARKKASWQAEKHQMVTCIDDLETKLLVKEEEVIKLSHEIEISRKPVHSKPLPDDVKFNKGGNNEGSHFFHKQGGQEEKREVLDLRCEVLSLQDCLGIKTQTIKTMEKELARSYNIVTELRSKVRALQECERHLQRQGQNKELLERLMGTERRLQKSLSERAVLSNKIQDLSARCKYLEQFEHLHREGSSDVKAQAIEALQKELERNVHIMQSLQARCDKYETRVEHTEARNMLESAGGSSERGASDSWEQDYTQLAQLSDEKQALAAECEQLQSQIKRKDQVIIQLQGDMQNLMTQQNLSSSIIKYQQNGLAVFHSDGISKTSKATSTSSPNYSVPEHGKVELKDVNTLTELLKEQWKLQKVMEDRLNTMMAYVSDRVDEFEQMSPSDASSNASFLPPNAELNHFHVEAKLMKLQLEQQLQVLRGQVFTSLPASDVASPGQQCPQNCLSMQNKQLWSEKNALEDSAQDLQEKTSRLLNRLTVMRSEYGPSSRQC